MSTRKILFLDFEDSFSFNVVQELTALSLDVVIKNWKDFQGSEDFDLLVLGPGPGHPDDYQEIFPLLKNWKGKFFGICLGHQILWRLKGVEVKRSEFPLHGQKVKLNLNQDWQEWLNLPDSIWVQRYNSLAVKGEELMGDVINHLEGGEIMMSRCESFISYQFHPESVGTNCRDSFFRAVTGNLL